MTQATFPVRLYSSSDGTPAIDAEFGRITVLVGANGSGKSKALHALRSLELKFGEVLRPLTFVEGGRVIRIPNTLGSDPLTANRFSSPLNTATILRQLKQGSASSRIHQIVQALELKSVEVKIRHSEAVTAWQAAGPVGTCPVQDEKPLSKLCKMFSDVFPDIQLSFDENTRQLHCERGGNRYIPDELSDGERQAFFILADIALTTEPYSLILIDEPELNLNPRLADRLWNTIEDNLPNSVFVYATHSIGFAMRQNVDVVIALSSRGLPAIVVNEINDIPPHELREFLGAIPAIISAPGAIAVEGIDTSFDGGFYRWVVNRQELAVVPLGSSTDVIAATTRSGIWDKLAPEVRLAGVTDRDFRSDEQLNIDSRCIVLDYHEAESYLCEPEVLAAIGSSLGTANPLPSVADLENLVLEYFNQNLLRIAVTRMSSRAQIRLGVSLRKTMIIDVSDEAELRKRIEAEAISEEAKAGRFVGPSATLAIFEEELKRCREGFDNKNIGEVLKLCSGKELLNQLAPRVGCRDAAAVARAAYKHLEVSNFKSLAALRARISSVIST